MTSKTPEPLVMLRCYDPDCTLAVCVPESLRLRHLARFLWTNGEWLQTIVTPPGNGYAATAPLCPEHQSRYHTPKVLEAAREAMRKQAGK